MAVCESGEWDGTMHPAQKWVCTAQSFSALQKFNSKRPLHFWLIILTTLLFSIYYHPILQKEESRCKDSLAWGQRVSQERTTTKTKSLSFQLGFPIDSWQRICLPMQEMWVRSLGQEDPLEMEMAAYSSILAWKNPRTEEPVEGGWGEGEGVRWQSVGPRRVRHD